MRHYKIDLGISASLIKNNFIKAFPSVPIFKIIEILIYLIFFYFKNTL